LGRARPLAGGVTCGAEERRWLCGVMRTSAQGDWASGMAHILVGRVRRAATVAARAGRAAGGCSTPCARRTDLAARAVAAVRGGLTAL
jgi:hypothetical protein